MGKEKLQEFLQDLGRSVESRAHILQSVLKPKKVADVTGTKLSKSQKKKQKKKRSVLKNAIAINPSLGQERPEVETVVFHSPGSFFKKDRVKKGKKDQKEENDGTDMIDLRKASFEVMKFSINSMKGSEKEDAETRLAISLGAEPPKNKYLNYKELQEIRKAEKLLKQEQEKNSIKPDLKPKTSRKQQDKSGGGDGKSKSKSNARPAKGAKGKSSFPKKMSRGFKGNKGGKSR